MNRLEIRQQTLNLDRSLRRTILPWVLNDIKPLKLGEKPQSEGVTILAPKAGRKPTC